MKKKFTYKKNGFTLVEMLVGVTVFSLTIGTISTLLISAVSQQRAVLSSQVLLDQTSYALEYMSRAQRAAQKELSAPGCLSSNGLNYEIPSEYQINGDENLGIGLRFINLLQNNDCQEFFLQGTKLKYKRSVGLPQESILDLTSDKLEVVSLKFNLIGKSQDDDLQPRVTILMEVKGKGEVEGSQRIKIQATGSQRNIDVLR